MSLFKEELMFGFSCVNRRLLGGVTRGELGIRGVKNENQTKSKLLDFSFHSANYRDQFSILGNLLNKQQSFTFPSHVHVECC